MLELKDVCFARGGKQILDKVNLKIDDKKFVVITGPNGGGKSTIAKMIMGIEKPDSGKIFFNGEDITEKSISERANMGIGFAFQQPVRFKGITVEDLMDLSVGRKTNFVEKCDILSSVGLCSKDYLKREINSSLSGGELKRIEIATVVARGTSLSIFDEPEAGIDLWSFNNLIEVFENMSKTIQGSIVIISHQERILNIADQVILIEKGKVKEIGNKDDILPNLLNSTTRACSRVKEAK
ncbi:MAG: ATP-binding cassette domain-containing protein [Clostridia bacterium]|nr:ATP-binding cassette domain-containing protein [Clostridia bacterium]